MNKFKLGLLDDFLQHTELSGIKFTKVNIIYIMGQKYINKNLN